MPWHTTFCHFFQQAINAPGLFLWNDPGINLLSGKDSFQGSWFYTRNPDVLFLMAKQPKPSIVECIDWGLCLCHPYEPPMLWDQWKITSLRQGFASWELTYPFPKQFWRWLPFPEGWGYATPWDPCIGIYTIYYWVNVGDWIPRVIIFITDVTTLLLQETVFNQLTERYYNKTPLGCQAFCKK